MDILAIVLSSGVVSAIVSGWFNQRGKRHDYANAYYTLILERRVAAYEEVEQLIASIKVAVVGDDNRPYHFLFSNNEDSVGVYRLLHGTMANSLWLSDGLFELTRQLNLIVYSKMTEQLGPVEFGKQNYTAIAELRTKMEKAHAQDMMTLHHIHAFLKSKKPADSFASISRVS